ncbi:MAG TPA: hypothetical protein VHO67_15095 [Polyangia bacterium]|nr:hypothetical protein [Polyangia bacterium]
MPPVDPSDREAYLEEQIARQKRGEPVDVDWVRAELERVRLQQAETMARTQRRLRWLVLVAAVILAILWFKNGGLAGAGSLPVLGLILTGFLASFILGRRRP